MGYHYNQFTSKLKILEIEFHHRKNKTRNQDNIIKTHDPTKRLLTLRVSPSESCLNDDHEEGEQIEEEPDILHLNSINEPSLRSSIKNYYDSFKKIRDNESTFSIERRKRHCRCTCHSNGLIKNEIYHNDKCLNYCEMNLNRQTGIVIREEDLPPIKFINYIETTDFSNKGWFKRSVLKLFNKKKKVDNNNDTSHIEIIAASTTAPVAAPAPTPGSLVVPVTDAGPSDINQQLNSNQYSSFARRRSKLGTSHNEKFHVFDLNCECLNCEKKKQNINKPLEPWKLIINDASLHAARISTGSKSNYSIPNLTLHNADFTNSKHLNPLIDLSATAGRYYDDDDENNFESILKSFDTVKSSKLTLHSEALKSDPIPIQSSAVLYKGFVNDYNDYDGSDAESIDISPLNINNN